MLTYKFETDDAALAAKIFAALGAAPGGVASAAHTLVTPEPVPPQAFAAPVPFAAPMPTTTAAPAPAPAAAPAPAPAPAPVAAVASAPAAVQGAAPPGWTVGHIAAAAKAHADVHGPASLKGIVNEFGAKKATEIDPARWPEAYNRLVAGTSIPPAG